MNDFWKMRAEKYNDLFWSKDISYIDTIIKVSDFKKSDLVLDIGTGTGIVAKEVKPHVDHIIALDSSEDMLNKGVWGGYSFMKWDITKKLFTNNVFNKITARMVFHHILYDLDKVFSECFNILKDGGTLIVAEGVPPSNDHDIIEWFKQMFKYKEERITFTEDDLIKQFKLAGFKKVKSHKFIMKNFSINNWLDNSGIPQENIDIIIDMHINADKKIKDAYNMRINDDEILIESYHTIITGKK